METNIYYLVLSYIFYVNWRNSDSEENHNININYEIILEQNFSLQIFHNISAHSTYILKPKLSSNPIDGK